MEYLLTIGITSYNRTKELERLLHTITTKYTHSIEVLISEDNSPQKAEIEYIVSNYRKEAPFPVRFNSNVENLGYDRNLKRIIELSKGENIFFISDDDCFYPKTIDYIIQVIKQKSPGIIYAPFYYRQGELYKRNYGRSYSIDADSVYAGKHIYDSILFSGLVFRRECVANLDAEPFLNRNYFQVYMFLYCVSKYGGYYLKYPTVECIGDGENAYGKSDSSDKNPLLADRESVFSNLEFHKGLIFVVNKFDEDYGYNTFKAFQNEYNIRSIVGMSRAEALGKKTLIQYWRKLKTLDIKLSIIPKIYFAMLMVFGERLTNIILKVPKALLMRKRNEFE